VSIWIRKEIQAVLWKNYTPLKWSRSHSEITLLRNAGTSVEQIERFCARNLPWSKEMAINLQSFGGNDED
jgi:hypothetical protein